MFGLKTVVRNLLLRINFILLLAVVACATTPPPNKELVYASAAQKAAEKARAEKRAPDLYRKAENTYWRARQMYFAKEFDQAKTAAIEARRLFESAEAQSEIKAAAENE